MKKITRFIIILIFAAAIGTNCTLNQINSNPKETIVEAIHVYYPHYDTAEDLINHADLIFYGTVKNISCEMLDIRTTKGSDNETDKMPYTLYTMHIEKLFQGNTDGEEITIKVPGGIFGNVEYRLEDKPDISTGSTYLFLAQSYENTYPSLLNVTQSVYDINTLQTYNNTITQEISLTDILAILNEKNASL